MRPFETLAYMLGEGWTQKKVSQLEAKEIIEQDILEQVVKILQVTPEAIKKFPCSVNTKGSFRRLLFSLLEITKCDFQFSSSFGVNY